jgi:nucleoid-associated protein YgaU
VVDERLEARRAAQAAAEAAAQAAAAAEAEAAAAAEEAKHVHAVHEAHLAAETSKKHAEEHKLRSYTVKKGDTLSEIGAHFKVDWREIAKINHVKNPDLIYPGQVFAIPND